MEPLQDHLGDQDRKETQDSQDQREREVNLKILKEGSKANNWFYSAYNTFYQKYWSVIFSVKSDHL